MYFQTDQSTRHEYHLLFRRSWFPLLPRKAWLCLTSNENRNSQFREPKFTCNRKHWLLGKKGNKLLYSTKASVGVIRLAKVVVFPRSLNHSKRLQSRDFQNKRGLWLEWLWQENTSCMLMHFHVTSPPSGVSYSEYPSTKISWSTPYFRPSPV